MLGQQDDALKWFKRAETVAIDASSAEGDIVVQAVTNQACMLTALHDTAAAEARFELALALARRAAAVSGKEDTNEAIALHGLGAIRNEQHRHADAVTLLEQALAIFERAHGPDFEDCARTCLQLATAFAHLGD